MNNVFLGFLSFMWTIGTIVFGALYDTTGIVYWSASFVVFVIIAEMLTLAVIVANVLVHGKQYEYESGFILNRDTFVSALDDYITFKSKQYTATRTMGG